MVKDYKPEERDIIEIQAYDEGYTKGYEEGYDIGYQDAINNLPKKKADGCIIVLLCITSAPTIIGILGAITLIIISAITGTKLFI